MVGGRRICKDNFFRSHAEIKLSLFDFLAGILWIMCWSFSSVTGNTAMEAAGLLWLKLTRSLLRGHRAEDFIESVNPLESVANNFSPSLNLYLFNFRVIVQVIYYVPRLGNLIKCNCFYYLSLCLPVVFENIFKSFVWNCFYFREDFYFLSKLTLFFVTHGLMSFTSWPLLFGLGRNCLSETEINYRNI